LTNQVLNKLLVRVRVGFGFGLDLGYGVKVGWVLFLIKQKRKTTFVLIELDIEAGSLVSFMSGTLPC